MDKEWLTLKDLAEQSGIPQTTVTRYCQTHRTRLENRRFGRRRKYRPVCVGILQTISEWYSQGLSSQEITEKLAVEIPATLELETALAKRRAPNVPALLESLAEDQADRLRVLAELKDAIQEQRAQLERLTALLQRPLWQRLFGRKAK